MQEAGKQQGEHSDHVISEGSLPPGPGDPVARPKGKKKESKKAAVLESAERVQQTSSEEEGPQYPKRPKAASEPRRRKKAREALVEMEVESSPSALQRAEEEESQERAGQPDWAEAPCPNPDIMHSPSTGNEDPVFPEDGANDVEYLSANSQVGALQ